MFISYILRKKEVKVEEEDARDRERESSMQVIKELYYHSFEKGSLDRSPAVKLRRKQGLIYILVVKPTSPLLFSITLACTYKHKYYEHVRPDMHTHCACWLVVP